MSSTINKISETRKRLRDKNDRNSSTIFRRADLFQVYYKYFDKEPESEEFKHYFDAIKSQLDECISKLIYDPETRQAYASTWSEKELFVERPYCIVGWNFYKTGDRINLINIFRSTDIEKLDNDLRMCVKILKYVCKGVELEPGIMTCFFMNLHEYLNASK